MEILTEDQILDRMSSVPGWELAGKCIRREFTFKTFVETFGWMSSVAIIAQCMDHHPDWRNVYTRVSVELTTHDARGLTDKDFKLAREMNRLYRD
jgi:4a-hydroxytetrahydrobiopterin dehydratase